MGAMSWCRSNKMWPWLCLVVVWSVWVTALIWEVLSRQQKRHNRNVNDNLWVRLQERDWDRCCERRETSWLNSPAEKILSRARPVACWRDPVNFDLRPPKPGSGTDARQSHTWKVVAFAIEGLRADREISISCARRLMTRYIFCQRRQNWHQGWDLVQLSNNAPLLTSL